MMERPSKRKRLSVEKDSSNTTSDERASPSGQLEGRVPDTLAKQDPQQHASAIALNTSAKVASQTIAPFLVSHIPYIHAPLGNSENQERMSSTTGGDPNSKYCYRHRSDLKCRRQADEPSMEQLQAGLESLPPNDQQGIAHVWALFSAAPAKQRNLMLQGILTQCCFPQLSYLEARTRELIKIDFLTALPTELGLKVLYHLDTASLTKAAQVSKRWRELADDDLVWHRMCAQHIDRKCTKCGWGLPLLERKRLMASKKEMERREANMMLKATHAECRSGTPVTEQPIARSATLKPVLSSTRPWKDVYRDRFKVGCNWKHGRFSIKTLRGHTDGVTCLQFDDNILITGSYDAHIKVWDLAQNGGVLLRTLRGHTSGLRCISFDAARGLLASGAVDTTVRLWNWRTGECIKVLPGHTSTVVGVHLASKLIASGSADRTIKVWDFDKLSCTTLRGHDEWVNCVRIDLASRTLLSASDDLTVKLWDLDSKRVIRTFETYGQIQTVVPLPREYDFDEQLCEDEHLSDGYISHMTTPEPDARDTYTTTTTTSDPNGSQDHEAEGNGDDNGDDGDDNADDVLPEIKLDPADQSRSDRLFAPSTTRAAPPHYMLTGGLDNLIRLWDVRSGRCIRTFFGHVEGVWALAADTLRVVSGGQDRTVKVWDPKTGKCERTFTGHAGPVTCLGLGDSRMCTGSQDGEVKVYNFGQE